MPTGSNLKTDGTAQNQTESQQRLTTVLSNFEDQQQANLKIKLRYGK